MVWSWILFLGRCSGYSVYRIINWNWCIEFKFCLSRFRLFPTNALEKGMYPYLSNYGLNNQINGLLWLRLLAIPGKKTDTHKLVSFSKTTSLRKWKTYNLKPAWKGLWSGELSCSTHIHFFSNAVYVVSKKTIPCY